ncbi:MAG: Enoyl-CoA hydratase/isomerase [Anaerolineaceae bacterium]|nr:MAG: Enoyl-CoA hydratase/isomerase [Anaerolineaceae bacterium]
MELKNLLIETTDGIAVVTINRPQSLNALNSDVVAELDSALHALEADAGVKVVVITGAGEKAFVAGGDIKEMLDMDPAAGRAFAQRGQQMIRAIEQMKKPVIAAVNGYALGGGLELALACDFIYASEKAKLGLPEVTLGIMPGFGGTQNLPRLIGPNRAKEMIFSGKQLTAGQAREWGLVNEVAPAEELMARVMEIAKRIAANGALGVSAAKDAVSHGLDMAKEDGLRYEGAVFGLLFNSEDQKEGMRAFVEKRPAEFKGK